MSNCYCKYRLEISRLLSRADMCIIEISRIFYQVTQLLRNSSKIVFFLSFWNVPENFVNVYKDSIM